MIKASDQVKSKESLGDSDQDDQQEESKSAQIKP